MRLVRQRRARERKQLACPVDPDAIFDQGFRGFPAPGAANAFLPGPPACLRSLSASGGQAPYGCRSGQDTDDLQEPVVLAFQTSKPFGFGDAGVPVALLPEGEGRGAAPEIAAELLYDLLFGECACFHKSSSLSGAHKGSLCAPPGEIRVTLISFVHIQGAYQAW